MSEEDKKPLSTETVHMEIPPAAAAKIVEEKLTPGKVTNHDPLWDVRRHRLDIALGFAAIYAMSGIVLALYGVDGDTLASLAVFVSPAFGLVGVVLPAYFGVAEWGRINGVIGNNPRIPQRWERHNQWQREQQVSEATEDEEEIYNMRRERSYGVSN